MPSQSTAVESGPNSHHKSPDPLSPCEGRLPHQLSTGSSDSGYSSGYYPSCHTGTSDSGSYAIPPKVVHPNPVKASNKYPSSWTQNDKKNPSVQRDDSWDGSDHSPSNIRTPQQIRLDRIHRERQRKQDDEIKQQEKSDRRLAEALAEQEVAEKARFESTRGEGRYRRSDKTAAAAIKRADKEREAKLLNKSSDVKDESYVEGPPSRSPSSRSFRRRLHDVVIEEAEEPLNRDDASSMRANLSLRSSDSGYQSAQKSIRIRDFNTREENAAWAFLEHAKTCSSCQDPYKTYKSHKSLCDQGTLLAQGVVRVLSYEHKNEIRSRIDQRQVSPGLQFENIQNLLKAVKRSRNAGRPIVTLEDYRNQSPQIYVPLLQPIPPPTSALHGRTKRYHGYDGSPVVISQSENKAMPSSTMYPSYHERLARHHDARSIDSTSSFVPSLYTIDSEDDHRMDSKRDRVINNEKYQQRARRSSISSNEAPPVRSGNAKKRKSNVHITTPTSQRTSAQAQETSQSNSICEEHLSQDEKNLDKGKNHQPRVIQLRNDNRTNELMNDSTVAALHGLPTLHDSPAVVSQEGRSTKPIETRNRDYKSPQSEQNEDILESVEKDDFDAAGNKEEAGEDIDSDGLATDDTSDVENSQLDTSLILRFDEPERALHSAVIQVKNLLLRGLLDYAAPEATDGLEGSSSQKRARDSPTSDSSQVSGRPPQKRARGGGRDPGDGGDDSGDDEDESNGPPKRNEKPLPFGIPNRRLKCPFYQREPEKHARAACRGEGFADMAKLKDHIKRVHTQPLRCSRCWKQMKSEDAFEAHLQAETICDRKPEPADDRIQHRMLKRLDFKKAPYAQAKSTEQKWNILYKVLFPDDGEIPSPYDQHGFTPKLERILGEALEEELTKELAPALDPILLKIKQRIPAIIQTCKLRLLSESPERDNSYEPSGIAFSSTDSELGDRQIRSQPRRSTTAPDCVIDTAQVMPYAANGKGKGKDNRPQHERSSPSGSSTDSFQGSRHESSPDSIFDRGTSSLSPVSNTYNTSFNTSVPSASNPAHLGAHLGDIFNSMPLPGSFPGSNIDYATATTEDFPHNIVGNESQREDFSALNLEFNPGESSSQLEGQVPLALNTMPAPQDLSNINPIMNDPNAYAEFSNHPTILDLDFVSENFDFDQFLDDAAPNTRG